MKDFGYGFEVIVRDDGISSKPRRRHTDKYESQRTEIIAIMEEMYPGITLTESYARAGEICGMGKSKARKAFYPETCQTEFCREIYLSLTRLWKLVQEGMEDVP